MNPDFADLLLAFNAHEVRYLVVGAYALAAHDRPRASGDLDVWVEPNPENAARVIQALTAFGAPLDQIHDADFATPGIVLQMGLPPGRIDVLTELTALRFEEAWPDRLSGHLGDVPVAFIGREAFVRNKRATGRARDLGDIEALSDPTAD